MKTRKENVGALHKATPFQQGVTKISNLSP
jgi:hypothetical protein